MEVAGFTKSSTGELRFTTNLVTPVNLGVVKAMDIPNQGVPILSAADSLASGGSAGTVGYPF